MIRGAGRRALFVLALAVVAVACGGDDGSVTAPARPTTVDDGTTAPPRTRALTSDPTAPSRALAEPPAVATGRVHVLGSVRVLPASGSTWLAGAPVLGDDSATVAPLACAPDVAGCPVEGLDGFALAGLDVVGLAGVGDAADLEALTAATTRLEDAGIRTAGFGASIDDAVAPALVESDAGTVAVHAVTLRARADAPVATVATAGVAGPDSIDALTEAIRDGADRGHFVVVLATWGADDARAPTPDEVATAEALVAAGASVVVGNGAGHLQRFDVIDGATVVYDLGSSATVFDDPLRRDTAILRVPMGGDSPPCLLPATASADGPVLDDAGGPRC